VTEPLDELLRGDVARWVQGSLLRDMNRELRSNGKPPPAFAKDLLASLSEVTGSPSPAAASGSAFERVGTAWSTVRDAATRTGRSERRIRQLASTGAIAARKRGRDWEIDLDSLTNVLRRAA
jgi:hypothetical protein